MTDTEGGADRVVRHFRQILVWPLQLMPCEGPRNHWDVLLSDNPANPWREVQDEFANPADFQERHYNEFVAFLPYAQRMLYGEGKGCGNVAGESPIRVFRRTDVAKLRVTFPGDETQPLALDVAHIDLYFFYDMDVVILVTEICADQIPFARAHEILFRFGRSYPTYWTQEGRGGHCFSRVEWIGPTGQILSSSDYERRDKYLSYACRYRAPCISSHWEFILRPLVLHHSDEAGPTRYRLVEYHRMPVCGFLTLDDPHALTRADFMRLALVSPPGSPDVTPLPERMGWDFESRFCYDRFWDQKETGLSSTRSMCSGEAFMMVGSAGEGAYPGGGPALRELFRHQYFLVFLIAHLQKAALLMMSDRLLHALNRLVPGDAESVRRFKREIRQLKEIFLRFTHRYWHHELSDQLMAKALYRMCQEHLDNARLFDEVAGEIDKMDDYLDSDSIRRQANMVVRLTVTTIFGLIGTVATGFLGMNLLAEAERPMIEKIAVFLLVFVPTIALTFYTIIKSKRLADFLDALSDERLPMKAKLATLVNVWKPPDPMDRWSP
ncbi:MAG TPA: hypothetical protein VJM11_01725 [Nevskiaceae bacterium]|nr:hypothetical protein [Nevskiaceae bacterium]